MTKIIIIIKIYLLARFKYLCFIIKKKLFYKNTNLYYLLLLYYIFNHTYL